MEHFKDFKGFGISGVYLSHSSKSPSEVARDLLSTLTGKRVEIFYEAVNSLGWKKNKYEPYKTFQPHRDFFIVSTQCNSGYLSDVNTDNIKIHTDGLTYEIQKIFIGEKWITELRQHDGHHH